MSETATAPGITPTAEQQAATGGPGSAEAELLPLLADYLNEISARTAVKLGDIAGVAITLNIEGTPITAGASSALARDVDLIQYQVGTGPCLHTLQHGVGMYVPDLAADERWGEYGRRAAARGAASCVSVPITVDEQPTAVLKVYADAVDGLSERQRTLAQLTAPEIAGGFALVKHLARQAQQLDGQAQLLDDRVAAMSTRRVIDLAIGVLMQKLNADPDTAFTLLRNLSQTRNTKLHDVAQQIIASLPGAGGALRSAPFNLRGQQPRSGR